MEITGMPRILAFSAILALGAGLGRSKPAAPAGSSLPGAYGPSAKEDKTDCDDCVIVRTDAESGAGTGEAPGTLLAGTLWGLFLVRRPKRMPRAVIRGVTVP